MIAVTATGPLFEGTLDVKRGMRVGMERATARAADIAREHLRPRSRYSTPKYGHAADSVVTKITTVSGAADQSIGSAYIGKQAGYLGPWLEFGTSAHGIAPKIRNRRATRYNAQGFAVGSAGRSRPRALLIGKNFRPFAHHPGTRAYRWKSLSQAQINREAPAIFETAMAEALKA